MIIAENPEALATIIAIFAAMIVAAGGFWANQKRQREDHTVAILMERFRNDYIRHGRRVVYKMSDDGLPIVKSALTSEDYHDILNLLSFYEFLAVSYLQNRIDRKTVRRLSERSIVEVYGLCRQLIEERRKLLGRPKLFGDLERFVRQFE